MNFIFGFGFQLNGNFNSGFGVSGKKIILVHRFFLSLQHHQSLHKPLRWLYSGPSLHNCPLLCNLEFENGRTHIIPQEYFSSSIFQSFFVHSPFYLHLFLFLHHCSQYA